MPQPDSTQPDDKRLIPRQLVNTRREEQPRSLLDLIEQDTIPIDLAAWWMSHVSRGASYIVGSGPGGVGKSTTMRSFLSVTPGHLPYAIAMPGEVKNLNGTASCVISHELSDHPPPAYLWDQDLRDFFALVDNGHTVVSNVHASDLAEIRSQVVETCSVPESQFHAVAIFAFIWLEGVDPGERGRIKNNTSRRYITNACYSDGSSGHRPVYSHEDGLAPDAPGDADYVARCRTFLEDALGDEPRDIDHLRERFLSWENGS